MTTSAGAGDVAVAGLQAGVQIEVADTPYNSDHGTFKSRLEFKRSAMSKPTHTGLESVVLGLVGQLGVDVLEEGGVYQVTPAFDAKIRQRNLYRFT